MKGIALPGEINFNFGYTAAGLVFQCLSNA